MAFTAADVKKLREMTSVGMMDCKKALTEADGDFDKAIELLREKGLAKAAKKADRIAAEGLVKATVCDECGVKENKVSVENHIKAVAKELGGEIKLVKCVRFEKGEGIEKKVDDFAAEVASMAK